MRKDPIRRLKAVKYPEVPGNRDIDTCVTHEVLEHYRRAAELAGVKILKLADAGEPQYPGDSERKVPEGHTFIKIVCPKEGLDNFWVKYREIPLKR